LQKRPGKQQIRPIFGTNSVGPPVKIVFTSTRGSGDAESSAALRLVDITGVRADPATIV
jgi:hypothetical protein